MNVKYFGTVFITSQTSDQFPTNFAILTACNPMDKMLSQDENLIRNMQLLEILNSNGHYSEKITGSSRDLSHQEPSLITDISRGEALKLGSMFEQRAIFWVAKDFLEIIECSTGIAHSAGSFRKRLKKK